MVSILVSLFDELVHLIDWSLLVFEVRHREFGVFNVLGLVLAQEFGLVHQ